MVNVSTTVKLFKSKVCLLIQSCKCSTGNDPAVIGKLHHLESITSNARQRPSQFHSSLAPLIDHVKRKEPLWRILISNKRFTSGYDPAHWSYENIYLSLSNSKDERDDADTCSINTSRSEYEMCIDRGIASRCLLTTKSGFVGTCVPDSCMGDVVAILFGSSVPFILRPNNNTEHMLEEERSSYPLLGGAYVGGIMSGEMVNELYCEDLMDSTTFFIH